MVFINMSTSVEKFMSFATPEDSFSLFWALTMIFEDGETGVRIFTLLVLVVVLIDVVIAGDAPER
jgi:hypothetical protein